MKVAIVTGGSRGLGRETALALGRAGYGVAVNYRINETAAREVAGLIGEHALCVRADVGDAGEVRAMANEVDERFGRLDALINNAGRTTDALLVRTTVDVWDELMAVNLKGPFNTIKSFTPLMKRSGGGHILNVSSYTALKGRAGQAAYGASKAALLGLTRVAAMELAMYNIKVNALVPGYMPTGMGAGSAQAIKRAREESLVGMHSSAADVAGFIVMLMEFEGATGQIFALEGRVL